MRPPETTSWDLIESAAAGDPTRQNQFVALYGGLLRRFLTARWRGTRYLRRLEDAVQDAFVECFKPDGVLQAADRGRPAGFRAFLQGVVRHVAQRHESSAARELRVGVGVEVDLDDVDGHGTSLSRVFDREWALELVREAAAKMTARAARLGAPARRRVDLLRLRFQDGLPIRDIAERWQVDPAYLHHQYGKARAEFRALLLQVIALHHPGSDEEIERICHQLLERFD